MCCYNFVKRKLKFIKMFTCVRKYGKSKVKDLKGGELEVCRKKNLVDKGRDA